MKIHDIAKAHTKKHTLPRLDREKYQERDGLEGPIMTKSGKVVYYDPKEDLYYDPDTDMYIDATEYDRYADNYDVSKYYQTDNKNEDAMSAEEIGKYPDLGWTNVNDTQEVKTYLNNMPHTPRVKIETFRQRVTEPHFQKFLKKYMTDHPDEPYDSVDSKPVTTNAPVKGHHNEDAVSDQVKGSDPMPKAKPGRTDHPYRGMLVGSKFNEESEFSEKQIKMAFGILNDPRYKDGNYSGAVKAIEKLAKGLSEHPSVANALKRANESIEK